MGRTAQILSRDDTIYQGQIARIRRRKDGERDPIHVGQCDRERGCEPERGRAVIVEPRTCAREGLQGGRAGRGNVSPFSRSLRGASYVWVGVVGQRVRGSGDR